MNSTTFKMGGLCRSDLNPRRIVEELSAAWLLLRAAEACASTLTDTVARYTSEFVQLDEE
jgi:hypothetical protein